MTKTIVNMTYVYRERVFFTLVFLIIILFLSYGALVHAMVRNDIARQNLKKQFSPLTQEINSLEIKYISLKNSVTKDIMMEKGYIAPEKIVYLSKQTESALYKSGYEF